VCVSLSLSLSSLSLSLSLSQSVLPPQVASYRRPSMACVCVYLCICVWACVVCVVHTRVHMYAGLEDAEISTLVATLRTS
jgi:sensor histidine kinase regulating citrate/malate metabolism